MGVHHETVHHETVEVKTGERGISPAIRYFKQRTPVPKWDQVHLGDRDASVEGVRILPFAQICAELLIP